jgi:hypothetical protein
MMVAYVAVPARLVGVRSQRSRRDRISASALGAILRSPGFVLFALGITLQAGATSAVRAVKMGAKLRG